MPRWGARVDAGQERIVAALRAVGASVALTHRQGQGFPDLVVFFRGIHLLEVKQPGEKLTPAEAEFHARWKGPVSIVHDADDALAAIGAEVER